MSTQTICLFAVLLTLSTAHTWAESTDEPAQVPAPDDTGATLDKSLPSDASTTNPAGIDSTTVTAPAGRSAQPNQALTNEEKVYENSF